jgi:hypothetical protein
MLRQRPQVSRATFTDQLSRPGFGVEPVSEELVILAAQQVVGAAPLQPKHRGTALAAPPTSTGLAGRGRRARRLRHPLSP